MTHQARLLAALGLTGALCAAPPAARAADSLLDQALNGDTAAQPATQPARPAAGPAAQPAAASQPAAAPYSPDAASAVDNQGLVNDLTGQNKNDQPSLPDALRQALTHMDAPAQRLDNQDAGAVTQEHQRRVVLGLDELINIAQQQQQQSGSNGGQPQPGQRRQKNPGQNAGQQQSQGQNSSNPAQQSFLPSGSPNDPTKNPDIHEHGTEWGNLPPRDRDLIVHGSKEEALPSYRDLVNRYYQALAELGSSTHENQRP